MNILNHFSENSELMGDILPGLPVVEISGNCRVLIEGHMGVKAYSREKIVVNTRIGAICVCGCGMELQRMTREQLVIRGKIDTVSLHRRE